MSNTKTRAVVDKSEQKTDFATPLSEPNEKTTGKHTPNRKRGKVDKVLFLELLKKGETQANAYKASNSFPVTEKTASVNGYRLSGELLADADLKYDVTKSLESYRRDLLEGITRDKIEKSGIKDIAISVGIFTEKIQLLRGMPTENVQSLNINIDIAKNISDDDIEKQLLG